MGFSSPPSTSFLTHLCFPVLIPSTKGVVSSSFSHHLLSGDCEQGFPWDRHVTSPAQTSPICEMSNGHPGPFNTKGFCEDHLEQRMRKCLILT